MSAYRRPAYYGGDGGPDFLTRVGLGLVEGFSPAVIMGNRQNADSGDIVKNWAAGGTYLYPDDAGEAMEIAAPAGIVTDVLVSGLGPDLTLQDSVIVTTNGATPVLIPGLWSRILGLRNVGAVRATGGIVVQAAGGSIEPFCETSENTQRAGTGMYTVPAGYSAQVMSVIGSMEKTSGNDAGASFELYQKQQGGVEIGDFAFGVQRSGTTSVFFQDLSPSALPEKTDIVCRCDVSNDGTTDLLVRVTLLLSKNSITGIDRG